MLEKLKLKLGNFLKLGVIHSVLIIAEIVVIGLGQIILDYGSFKVYTLCYILGAVHISISRVISKQVIS